MNLPGRTGSPLWVRGGLSVSGTTGVRKERDVEGPRERWGSPLFFLEITTLKLGKADLQREKTTSRKEESALRKGESRSLLSEGQAWSGKPGRRRIWGTRENCRGPETMKHLRTRKTEKRKKKTF